MFNVGTVVALNHWNNKGPLTPAHFTSLAYRAFAASTVCNGCRGNAGLLAFPQMAIGGREEEVVVVVVLDTEKMMWGFLFFLGDQHSLCSH